MSTPREIIIAEIRSAGIPHRISSKDIFIRCPFHHDSQPSLGIHLSGNYAHCLGCKWTGNWDQVAEKLKLRALDSEQIDADLQLIKDDLEILIQKSQPAKLPISGHLVPWNKDWRGIPKEVLKPLAYEWYDQASMGYRILFPLKQRGELVGWTSRAVDNIQPKHKHLHFMSALSLLFPFDYVAKHFSKETVILVEGPHDALAGITMGVPTLSIMGTGAWSEWKATFVCSTYNKAVILMDGDEAGRSASLRIHTSLSNLMEVQIISLHEGDDPGSIFEDTTKRFQWEWILQQIK